MFFDARKSSKGRIIFLKQAEPLEWVSNVNVVWPLMSVALLDLFRLPEAL